MIPYGKWHPVALRRSVIKCSTHLNLTTITSLQSSHAVLDRTDYGCTDPGQTDRQPPLSLGRANPPNCSRHPRPAGRNPGRYSRLHYKWIKPAHVTHSLTADYQLQLGRAQLSNTYHWGCSTDHPPWTALLTILKYFSKYCGQNQYLNTI